MSHDYEGKIAKLLAKAESTTPQEAEALTAQAEKLMVKYSIDRATIAARQSESHREERIVTKRMQFYGTYQTEWVKLGCGVASVLGDVRAYTQTAPQRRKEGRPVFIVGYESDVAAAKFLITSLQLQDTTAMHAWWKANADRYSHESAGVKHRYKRNFLDSFTMGAMSRIREARRVAESEAEKDVPGTALAVRDRQQEVRAWMNSNVGPLRNAGGGSRKDPDPNAHNAGFAAGQRASTGEGQVGGNRGAIAR